MPDSYESEDAQNCELSVRQDDRRQHGLPPPGLGQFLAERHGFEDIAVGLCALSLSCRVQTALPRNSFRRKTKR